MANREQPVAVAGRVLEPFLRRGLLHAALELQLDRPRLAREELDHPVDDLPVGLLVDVADARGLAPLDAVVEARDPRVAAGFGPSHGRYWKTRLSTSSVSRTFFAFAYGPKYTTPRRCRSRVNITRGYSSSTVTAMYGNDLSSRRRTLNGGRCRLTRSARRGGPRPRCRRRSPRRPRRARKLTDPSSVVAAPLEVGPHAGAQRLRLSDVEHAAAGVPEQVHAGLRRQALQLLLDASSTDDSGYRQGDEVPLAVAAATVAFVIAPAARPPAPLSSGPRGRCEGRDARRSETKLDLLKLAGLEAVRVTAIWDRGPASVCERSGRPEQPDGRREARRYRRVRVRLQLRQPDDAADRPTTRRASPTTPPSSPAGSPTFRLHHRQRAEPEPLLAAAIQPGRLRRGRARLPLTARPHVLGAESGGPDDQVYGGATIPARHRPAGCNWCYTDADRFI